jgi:hypothetical protein
MAKRSFAVTVFAALTVIVGASPAGAAGPHGAVAPAGVAAPGPVVAQSIVQDRIVPGGFFTLPTAGPRVVKDTIVPHGFFSLPAGAHRRPFRRSSRRFAGAGIAPSVIVTAPAPVVPGDYSDAGYYEPPDDSPAAYAPPVAYDNPPVVYAQPVSNPVTAAPAPPPPQPPSVVQYDTGRYELRGDGMTTPYTWVWIPNPPPPPPSGPPTAAVPGAPPFSDDAPAGHHSQLYRWTDEQGVMHLTDRLESVPRQYRTLAKQTPPS